MPLEIHNTRSPQQWEIISKHIDFKDKTVLDLGVGYGDILLKCWQAGAKCVGIEFNLGIFQEVLFRVPKIDKDLLLLNWDIEDWINNNSARRHDIIICFSVLPYLKQPFTVLEWIKEHSQIALIEAQYKGDGPGFDLIENDGHMCSYLERVGWQSVKPIGKTLVKGRNMYRTIWLCQ